MSTGIISIGVTGMQAAQLGLVTAEHNITNANTPGYTRQRTIQATNVPVVTGNGFIGQGVHVSTIERMYSAVLNTQVVNAQASASDLDSYSTQIKQIDNMLADPNSGVSPLLQDFFRGVQQVAADPSSLPARQAMVSTAQAMTARFNSIQDRLSQMYDGVNSQITSTVGAINSYAQQIANLNQQIVVAQSSINQPANDLLDQRDQLVAELNKLVGVKTATQSDGSYNVFIGSGQQLVVGTQVITMTATAASADPSRIVVGLKTAGSVLEMPESLITGGSLSGLIRFRSESLDSSANQLGRVAASLTQTFNAQHALGQDLLGNILGSANFQKDFFSLNPATPKVINNANNTGTAVLAATFDPPGNNGTNFYNNLTASDYLVGKNGANYTVTRLSDNMAWSSATMPFALPTEGITIQLTSGAMNANDTFLIEPTREVARNLSVNAAIVNDPRLVAAAAPIRTQVGATNTGTATVTAGTVTTGYTAPVAGTPAVFTFAGGNLNVTGLANGTVINVTSGGVTTPYTVAGGTATFAYASGSNISFNNISFQISGTPGAGDTYSVSANTNGVADGRNAVLLGKLQTQNTVSGASATYQSSYAQLVSNVGNKTRATQVTLDAQKSLLGQATSAREALSGVNLDEEAASLIRYQQAYQASAKMLDIGAKLFDTLMSIGR